MVLKKIKTSIYVYIPVTYIKKADSVLSHLSLKKNSWQIIFTLTNRHVGNNSSNGLDMGNYSILLRSVANNRCGQ